MRRVSYAIAVSCLLHGALAHADAASAEALFREGRTLIKQGKLDAGCDKLDASEKLDSSVGTLLNLGDCREKQGRTATAWAVFRKAEALAKRQGNDKKRQREAGRRADKLEGSLSSITIQVGPTSKSDGTAIKRDGEALDPAVWGTAIVVDPGEHTIVAEAPNAKPWKTTVSVGKGGKRWVVVPTLEPVAVEPAPAPAPVPEPVVEPAPAPAPAVAVETPRTVTVTHTWSTTRGIGVALGVVGLAAIGGGAYYGNRSKDLEDRSNAICPDLECSDSEGLRLNDDAQTAAKRANIFFIGGGVAVAAATVMWFVGKPDAETVITPSIGADHVGASLSRRF
jgi:serine/threonine-protein kinase